MRDTNHFEYECAICCETWPTEHACKEHEIEDHLYCGDCDRFFRSYNNIQMVRGYQLPMCIFILSPTLTPTQHLRSRTHVGTNIKCPFCKDDFATATGMTHHLEGGACPRAQGLDRDRLYRFVRRKDPDSLISKRLIDWHGSDSYEATDQAWNGRGYECYLCGSVFSRLSGLNQHLKSPVREYSPPVDSSLVLGAP